MLRKEVIVFAILTVITLVVYAGTTPHQALAQSSLPIERMKDMAFDEEHSIVYVVNSDNTISSYDLKNNAFIFTRLAPSSEIRNLYRVLVNKDGSAIGLLYDTNSNEYRVTIYKVSLRSEGGKMLSAGPSYTLGGRTEQGRASPFFPDDGSERLLVGYGKSKLFILSTDSQKQEEVTVGQAPSSISIDDVGMILVVNGKSEDLSIVDPVKKNVRATVKLGSNPEKLIFNRVTGKAYVSHVGSDDVYVIDTKTASVVKKIKVGSDPAALVYDEDDGTVFVANNTSGEISVISPNYRVRTVNLGSVAYFESSPMSLAYLNNSKKLFILNTSEAKYLVYDVKTARIEREGKTDIFPVKIFASDNQQIAIISHSNANHLFIVDAKTFTVKRVPDTDTSSEAFFSKPQSVVIDTETNRIFVSNLGGNYITVIDGKTQKPIVKIPTDRSIQNVFLNKTTRKIYAVSPVDSSFSVIDISGDNYPVKTVKLEQQPRGGAINERTNKIYYSNSAVSKISVVDGSKDEVEATINLPAKSFPLVSSVDESRNKIYVALYAGNSIAVINGENNQVKTLIPTGQNPIWVRYLPDVNRVFVSVEGNRKVLVIDPENDEIIQAIKTTGRPYRIFFDKETKYVYINYRDEDTVSILRENNGNFEILDERPIGYWGQTDGRPYNMIIYNDQTKLAYLTAVNETVTVVRVGHDVENILIGEWYATINADGSVTLPKAATSNLATIATNGAIAVIILLIVGTIALVLRRKSGTPVSQQKIN